ncbi:metallophosphoesterase [Caballeronia sp. S22]|uniref:metallophosphoesterase n=1 Tax=Caballeronia sp. S22 TaxID=3137182 RepID=UPI003530A5D3
MKVQLASDLHLELLARAFPGETVISAAHGADILVLAGDIANGSNAIDLFGHWPVPVLYVAGNHEFYHHCREDLIDELRRKAFGTSVSFLECDVADFGGVRFLGCTLWTDYRLGDAQLEAMKTARRLLNDHRAISTRGGTEFSPRDALNDHHASRTWLAGELSRQYDGVTVVATHHGPHPLSVHPRYAGDLLNGAFVSDLTPLLAKADFWFHGHVHDAFEYDVRGCRVVCNPLGYARNKHQAASVRQLQFESEGFEFARVIDVSTRQTVRNAGCGNATL